jgi:hypothetical protein
MSGLSKVALPVTRMSLFFGIQQPTMVYKKQEAMTLQQIFSCTNSGLSMDGFP